ncbi:gliding motility protein GldB [Chryseobacterium sp. FH1]|uniref:gliding motility lipoprotein GldB n=1 Tax=Chryseobacterium sp. FH1 TaxID=1233951 RepID=UPI0004E34444|nr:gliding motility protein GldB [Chryseobacterium sp. FH1]KFC20401.1 gliding motility protein GldB [Chryseobacterium sp. FH1]
MKFFRYISFSAIIVFSLSACKKENENRWDVEIKNPVKKINITDISGEFYNSEVSLEDFKKKYPWFQGSVPDADYDDRRKDTMEVRIYKEAISKIDKSKLDKDLVNLFSHIKNYFPKFQPPHIYLYSSVVDAQNVIDPIFLREDENMLFVDITGFLGDGNKNYSGLDLYFQKSMTPENLVPKISAFFASRLVPVQTAQQKFLDQMVYQGKIQILQEAFLPNVPEHLKMNYSKQQYDWAVANEANIWNYFVENDLLFSADAGLSERFITPGPFSKFYTEVDPESSPQIAIWTGWQICKHYLNAHPEEKLDVFLKRNATEIFNGSEYRPK